MRIETRMAPAVHDQAEQDEFLGLLAQHAARLHRADHRAKSLLRFAGRTRRAFALEHVRAAAVVMMSGI